MRGTTPSVITDLVGSRAGSAPTALSASPRARQYLEGIDQGQVVESDVIVVVLDVREGLLMTLHQRADLAVLPLLHLVDLSLSPQVKLISKHLHLFIILGLDF